MSAHIPRQPHELTDDEAIARLWRRGRFAAMTGALIGFGCCTVLVAGLGALFLLLPGARDAHLTAADVGPLILRAAGLVVLGAAIGLMITGVVFTGRLTSVLGTGAQSRRVRRAVFRSDPTPLTSNEQAQAVRYAPLGAASSQFQIVSVGALYLGILLEQIPQLVQDPSASGLDLRPVTIGTVGLLLLVYLGFLPLQIRNSARACRYVATHGRRAGPS